MRELKFRVWDGEYMYLSGGELWSLGSWFDAHCNTLKKDGVVFMQSTGLIDTLENDIYEGDIVQYSTPEESGIGEVVSFFGYTNLHFKWLKQSPASPTLYSSIDYFGCPEELKIIGNIYEDKKLLNYLYEN